MQPVSIDYLINAASDIIKMFHFDILITVSAIIYVGYRIFGLFVKGRDQ